ncbi:MAG: ABC transporter ATP-binding protein [Epulopiscium sp. Nuni2H_MBin003]|nr:MAG: ABC transporter ATP-binding protein [Epulopiscium sp. Nuni2H_MBin003]
MNRNGLKIMLKLLALVKPFTGIMLVTITMGILGFLSAIFITVFGAYGILNGLYPHNALQSDSFRIICIWLVVLSISRGILRYLEQSSGHYIAFKLLAFIRDKVFRILRILAPSKTDSKENGQVMALLTSDIELLEVFYAHTIAPIIIAVTTSIIMCVLISQYSIILAFVALMAYLSIGAIIPYCTAKHVRESGRKYRADVGELNQYFLESLRGMQEVLLFDIASDREFGILERSKMLDTSHAKIRAHEGISKAITESVLLGFSTIMLFTGVILMNNGIIQFDGLLISIIMLMSSYGPVVALSNLSNNLLQTLASGERVLDLLEEEPIIQEVVNGSMIDSFNIKAQDVNFSYNVQPILDNISLEIASGKILGICGPSGCGKSTLLKLLMQFYSVQSGNLLIGSQNVSDITTADLRKNISFVTQDTYLFDQTIAENLRVAKQDATELELVEACKKASIYDFILTLPEGFNSKVGELGDSLSGGEKQRIGIARAFLHDSPIILLDEPTSNLDSLNESIILNALRNSAHEKTIIIVSHRHSTMSVADVVHSMSIAQQ